VVVLGLGGWALAQPGQPAPKKAEAEGSRYVVSPAGVSAVMVDSTNGQSWILSKSVDGQRAAWIPIAKLDHAALSTWWDTEKVLEKKKQDPTVDDKFARLAGWDIYRQFSQPK
jgi:hypothetical protein